MYTEIPNKILLVTAVVSARGNAHCEGATCSDGCPVALGGVAIVFDEKIWSNSFDVLRKCFNLPSHGASDEKISSFA